MAFIIEFETSRLRMRQSPAAGDASIDTWQAQFAAQGWSNRAVALRESSEFIGFTGLSLPRCSGAGASPPKPHALRIIEGHPMRLHCLYRITRAEWGEHDA